MLLAEILRSEPYVAGVVFDVPDALTRAPERLAAAGVADRCRLEAGDFFAAVPEGAGASDRNTLFVDLLMLAVTGGRERTEREFRALLEQAGLATARVSDPLDLRYRVIEAVRG